MAGLAVWSGYLSNASLTCRYPEGNKNTLNFSLFIAYLFKQCHKVFFLDSQLVVLMQVCLGLSLPSSCVVGVSLAWVLWLSFCASLDLLVVEGLLQADDLSDEARCKRSLGRFAQTSSEPSPISALPQRIDH